MPEEYTIRITTPSDAEAVRDVYAPFVKETAVTFETELPSISQMAERVRSNLIKHLWLVCVYKGTVIGYAYGGVHRPRESYRWATETSVYVKEEHRKKGIARALYVPLLKGLALQGYKTALGGITLPNIPSEKFHESMGFIFFARYDNIGFKLGQWHATGWWRLALGSTDEPPQEIKPISQFLEHPEWKQAVKNAEDKINL